MGETGWYDAQKVGLLQILQRWASKLRWKLDELPCPEDHLPDVFSIYDHLKGNVLDRNVPGDFGGCATVYLHLQENLAV